MHAEVCSVLVRSSCVWNVDKYWVALQRLRVVDLIGQDVVGVLDLSGWREELGTLGNCGKYRRIPRLRPPFVHASIRQNMGGGVFAGS